MVGRRNGERIVRVLGHFQDVSGLTAKLLDDRIVEPLGPVERQVWLLPLNAAEIMDDVAAGDDHDAALAQWS